ncbi:MAG: 4Fe-4S dicluster domain-containing protein [Candidatus Hadarchaeales archaeon]
MLGGKKTRVVEKRDFSELIARIISSGTDVYAPVRQENGANFKRIKSVDDVVWGRPQTVIPPKFLMFPQSETLLKYETDGGVSVSPVVESRPAVLLGAHPCDINAIFLLDKVFSEKNVDENYVRRRENVTIVGVECLEPCSNESFCSRKDSAMPWGGYDLFLTDIGDRFYVEIGTKKGETFLAGSGRKPSGDEKRRLKIQREKKDRLFDRRQKKLKPELKDLPKLLRERYDSEVWRKRGERCLSCGSCNIVCPTCYCFDVRDCLDLNLRNGERFRSWDGCMLTDFTRVASGEVFREDRGARLRHRTNRKDLYLFEKWKRTFCTGCGRCNTACLTKIVSPLEIENELYAEARK